MKIVTELAADSEAQLPFREHPIFVNCPQTGSLELHKQSLPSQARISPCLADFVRVAKPALFGGFPDRGDWRAISNRLVFLQKWDAPSFPQVIIQQTEIFIDILLGKLTLVEIAKVKDVSPWLQSYVNAKYEFVYKYFYRHKNRT